MKGMSPNDSGRRCEDGEPSLNMVITRTAIMVPIISEPPSPRNIFDLMPNTLCRKNGIMAPAVMNVRAAMLKSPATEKNIPKTSMMTTP